LLSVMNNPFVLSWWQARLVNVRRASLLERSKDFNTHTHKHTHTRAYAYTNARTHTRTRKVSRNFARKPRPKCDLDCLICSCVVPGSVGERASRRAPRGLQGLQRSLYPPPLRPVQPRQAASYGADPRPSVFLQARYPCTTPHDTTRPLPLHKVPDPRPSWWRLGEGAPSML